VLIVGLALWLIGISLVLRFFSVVTQPRCPDCEGELEYWPGHTRCADCGKPVDPTVPRPAPTLRSPEPDRIHAIVAAVLQGSLGRRSRDATTPPGSLPARYQRASTGKTRSANRRTLS
jgi:hypothetical protein